VGVPPSRRPDPEIPPPWIQYPGYPPGDTFWRQTGEAWFTEVWRPYWERLRPDEQAAYLERWNVPEAWRLYCNPDFARWLEDVDSPDGG
jgi:hypothetical protein